MSNSTEERTSPEDAGDNASAPSGAPAEQSAQAEGDPGKRGDNEAAKYRRQLRETETERDTLRGRVDTMHRAEVERIAKSIDLPIHNAADLFEIGGITLEQLRGETGDIDAQLVTAAIETLRSERAYLFESEPKFPQLFQGKREDIPARASWAAALKP